MIPTSFDESNAVLAKPSDMSPDDCDALSVWRGQSLGGTYRRLRRQVVMTDSELVGAAIGRIEAHERDVKKRIAAAANITNSEAAESRKAV